VYWFGDLYDLSVYVVLCVQGINRCMYVRHGRLVLLLFSPFFIIVDCYYLFFNPSFQSISSQNERDMNASVTLGLNSFPIQEKITIAEVRTSLSY